MGCDNAKGARKRFCIPKCTKIIQFNNKTHPMMAPETTAPLSAMKTCGGPCGLHLPTSEFSIKDKKTQRLRSMCKACVRENSKKHYQNNTAAYVQKAGERNQRVIQENRLVVENFLSSRCCSACGATSGAGQDLHPHAPRSGEARPAWTLLTGSKETLLEELGKADVLCGTCLGKKTGESFQPFANMSPQERASKADAFREDSIEQGLAVKPKGFHQSYRAKGVSPEMHLKNQMARAELKAQHE
jgi:hypothetical protein